MERNFAFQKRAKSLAKTFVFGIFFQFRNNFVFAWKKTFPKSQNSRRNKLEKVCICFCFKESVYPRNMCSIQKESKKKVIDDD